MTLKSIFTIVLLCTCLSSFAQHNPLRLWYDKPANVWEEALPLGNGRLGMTPDGGVRKENIVLNDITLWSGAPQDASRHEAYKQLPLIRQLLQAGRNNEAQVLMDSTFICAGKGSAAVPFGCFQMLGNLELAFDYNGIDSSKVSPVRYERMLSLDSAVAATSFEVNGITYKREYFTSFGDDVAIIRLTASEPRQLSCRISMSRPERSTTQTEGQELQLSGQLESGTEAPGMQYLARVKATLKDGSITADRQSLVIRNASEIILYISAATDFRDRNFRERTKQLLETAIKKTYTAQQQLHISRYRRLFDRVSLQLGSTTAAPLPTDERLVRFYDHPHNDDALAPLFFQFGRYLSISSTRVGLLPPNLQGLWANQVQTPWNGDYHLDVNVQMNHWPVEVCNLPELDLPLAQLTKELVKPGERTAKAYYNAEGWVAHVVTNVWGYTEPGESASWGSTTSGSGWLCNNLWEHYAFTNDRKYLQDIYPVLKGAALFYSQVLVTDPQTGWLVTAPSASPENSFYLPNGKATNICMGSTFDNQLIRELFTNVIAAARQLGKDEAFCKTLRTQLKKLPPVGRIGKDGRLMEWPEEYREPDPKHRHITHLYGLYPASLITPEATPALAEACKRTLEVRGDDGPSWSLAYKLLFWARLHDGNRAYKLFRDLMRPTLKTNINYGAGGGVYPNLFTAGPPFQIDGNFGGTAGLAEMLLQSHAGLIDLLPALPDAWKSQGEVRGLKARGGLTVNITWKAGRVTAYRIASAVPRKVRVRLNGEVKEISTEKI